MYKDSQQGYLLISAIIIVVIVGFLAATVAYLVGMESVSSAIRLDSVRAFYIARSGLERSAYRLLSRNVQSDQRLACRSGEDGIIGLSESIFGGIFEVTDETVQQYISGASLSRAFDSTDSIIPVDDISHYVANPPRGRVMIDREVIDYRGISADETICGDLLHTPCLTNITRVSGAVTHAAGTPIAQNQCFVTVEGGAPNLGDAPPAAKRKLIGEVKQLEEGWIVGAVSAYGNVIRWDGAKWRRILNSDDAFGDIPAANLNDIEMLSYADVWAVGDSGNIIHWDGEDWDASSSGVTEHLQDVDCINHLDCRAVGANATFLSFGGSWGVANKNADVPAVSINAVSCADTNTCWAVGAVDTTTGGDGKSVLVEWIGSPVNEWKRETTSVDINLDQDLFGLSCLSSNFCKAVGNNGTFANWNGTSWVKETVAGVTTTAMSDVFCLDSSDCWAVGGNRTFVHWNGTAWSVVGSGGINLNAVTCVDSDDCWAVGSGGNIFHWNGSVWSGDSNIGKEDVPAVSLNGIGFIANHSQRPIAWHEDFG